MNTKMLSLAIGMLLATVCFGAEKTETITTYQSGKTTLFQTDTVRGSVYDAGGIKLYQDSSGKRSTIIETPQTPVQVQKPNPTSRILVIK